MNPHTKDSMTAKEKKERFLECALQVEMNETSALRDVSRSLHERQKESKMKFLVESYMELQDSAPRVQQSNGAPSFPPSFPTGFCFGMGNEHRVYVRLRFYQYGGCEERGFQVGDSGFQAGGGEGFQVSGGEREFQVTLDVSFEKRITSCIPMFDRQFSPVLFCTID